MAMPQLIVEVAFGDAWNVASPTWVNVTSYVRDSPPLRISRGTSRVSRPRPGSLTVTFGNNDRRFDPDYASGPYANDLVPMVPIRVTATHNAVTYTLFRGFVSDWGVNTQDGKDSTVTVTALDGLTVLQLLKIGQVWGEEVQADSPRAWYRFSDPVSSTTLIDSSGNGYHGTPSGSPTFGAAGQITPGTDLAATLDGTDDYIELPLAAAPTGTSDFSVDVLFKTTEAVSTGQMFLATDGQVGYQAIFVGVSFYIGETGGVVAYINSTDTTTGQRLSSATGYNDGAWHLATITRSGTAAKLYLDGAEVDTDTAGSTIDIGTHVQGNIHIGRTLSAASWFDGSLSEVVVYDSELSAARVLAHYNAAFAPLNNQLTSARVTAVLDLIGWPSALRDLDTGISTMGTLTDADITALEAIFQAVDTENGAAWITGAGKLWFGNRRWRDISAYSATFSNDGSDTGYQALSWHRDDTELRTVAQVTDSNSAVTEYVGASEATYGPRTISRTTYTTSVTEPYDMATWLYGEFGYANTDADLLLEAGAASATATWAELLSRELGDLVNVEVKPVGGTTQNDWDMFVEDITLSAGVDLWTLRLGLSNAGGATTAGQRGFVLDDATLGQLDGVGRLGF